jgi:xyloglucan-specific exo-beta-1,4-glucanase
LVKLQARLFGLALLVCSVGAVAEEVLSTPYVWRNVTVGAGGYAPGIVFSAAEKGLAYLRTDMGGAYRWDAKAQQWVPLQDALSESSYMGVESIAADPRNPDVVYLAAGMYVRDPAAILRSEDRGQSWTVHPVSFRMGGNEDGRGLGERLAIDPHRTSTLFFGSRHDGLQRSDDSGRTWRKVESFPWPGLGRPQPRRTHAGISFVLFDPANKGTIYAAVADPARHHLYRSRDGGATWGAVPGGPDTSLLPVKAALDSQGALYVPYATSMGPNDIQSGAVWKLDTRTGEWTDITPGRGQPSEGGFMGITADPARPGRVAVSSIDRWQLGDTIWLTNDGGRCWTSLRERSERDVAASPFLRWGRGEAEFGHWISGLAFDPFDGATLAYSTGATLYRTSDALRRRLSWKPWIKGIEQTAIISLTSPTRGAPLISGFGDISGFVHDRLDVSPPTMFGEPRMTNTNSLDYAGANPAIVVRSGSLRREEPQDVSLAWSQDGGRSWKPLRIPPIGGQRNDLRGEAPIAVSADGRMFVVSTPVVMVTNDRGSSWDPAAGLPERARVIADKADPQLFYAVDFEGSRLFASSDGARSFRIVTARGIPESLASAAPRNRESPSPLLATPGRRGELWLLVSGRLYRSTDAGESFAAASPTDIRISLFGLGRAAPGESAPALYAAAAKNELALWRSTDGGGSWTRINDEQHQWGLRFRVISGDPKIFGRVYVGTDGRGILYGDPAAIEVSSSSPPQPAH